MARRVVIMAGEASSDEYGALLVREMLGMEPDLELSGLGGPALAKAGVKLLYPPEELREMALVGFTEVVLKSGYIWRGMQNCKNHLRRTRPDLLILMDLPAFNLRLARHAKRLGIKVLYYITPQVWAWWTSRAKKMASRVDRLAVVFPFEKEFYAARVPELPVSFVGHPELDVDDAANGRDWPLTENETVVGLLPGSRLSEIRRHGPLLAETVSQLREKRLDLAFVLPIAPGLDREALEPFLGKVPGIALLPQAARATMRRARLILACSGTATLQAAARGTPMAVFYKMGRLNYFFCKRLMKVPYFAMPNLIDGGPLVPEFIQDRATPAALAAQTLDMLEHPERLDAMRAGLERVRQKLGGPGASRRTAELALAMLE